MKRIPLSVLSTVLFVLFLMSLFAVAAGESAQLREYRNQAARGDANAMNEIGVAYFNGTSGSAVPGDFTVKKPIVAIGMDDRKPDEAVPDTPTFKERPVQPDPVIGVWEGVYVDTDSGEQFALRIDATKTVGTEVEFLLYERNPWLTVIGSDSPLVACYADGLMIFLDRAASDHSDAVYKSARLDEEELAELRSRMNALDTLQAQYELSHATDQTTTRP